MAKEKTVTELAQEAPNTITLKHPVKRAGQTIEQVTLLTPNTGHLRGLSLAAVASAEVDALIKLLPRMTMPSLTEQEVASLSLPDMTAITAKVINFFG